MSNNIIRGYGIRTVVVKAGGKTTGHMTRYGWIPLLLVLSADAAELKQETLGAWDQYIQAADGRMQERLSSPRTFLWTDESPDRCRRVRNGEIVVAPTSGKTPQHAPSGLIHDWMGAAFIPNTNLAAVLTVVRDFSKFKENYPPNVVTAAAISRAESEDEFTVTMMNSGVLKSALSGEYQSSYTNVDAQRCYSVSHSVRLQQIDNFGRADERRLPPDQGNGYVWRLHSISRYQERDGGVYMEVELIALSRDIPASFRWVVDPIVRRISRSSLTTSLRQTGEAVAKLTTPEVITHAPVSDKSNLSVTANK